MKGLAFYLQSSRDVSLFMTKRNSFITYTGMRDTMYQAGARMTLRIT